jgi:hypothetical protein
MSSIESIQKENVELRRIIENHSQEISRCKDVIYQLVGGLFNQEKQKCILLSHTNVLYGKPYNDEDDDDDENSSIWPTTRQGDRHEERIRKMEEIIHNLEERVNKVEKKVLL